MRLAGLLLGLLCACTPLAARDYGEQLFNDAAFSGSQFNTWSCATCHDTAEGGTRLSSGYPVREVAGRPTFWGGNQTRLIDAASFCYVRFMRGAQAFDPAEPHSRALYEYLKSLSPSEAAEARPLTIVQTIKDVPRGEQARGAEVYRLACLDCHGEKGTGKGRNSERSSVLPDVAAGYPALFPNVAPSLVFIEKVRHGQFFGVSGDMPLFSTERLSDDDLGALLAYLAL